LKYNKFNLSDSNNLKTPYYLYSEEKILKSYEIFKSPINNGIINLLFPLKSLTLITGLQFIYQNVNGFSTSSLFEAKVANIVSNGNNNVHITTPIFRQDQFNEISYLCDYIIFNSLSQFERYSSDCKNKTNIGIRVNPQLSFIQDERYDPCRKNSKLGVSIDALVFEYKNNPKIMDMIDGILIHSNCESENFNELSKTIEHVEHKFPELLKSIKWINLGGGYLFESEDDLIPFKQIVNYLNNKYELEVFFEPGKAIVGKAGYLVSSVLDIFDSDNKKIVILDTTVNHMPEVFEYQYKPEVEGEVENGRYTYILAGCTCLAGDLFGEYSFSEPLEIGSRIVFNDMGAYTLVKAHMFNGVNLPDIYVLRTNGELELVKQFTFEDYLSRCGVELNDNKRKAVNYSSY